MLRARPSSAIFLAALVVGGCHSGAADESPLRVAVTVAPHVWLVEAIGGPRVEAMALVAPGESPATFQPTDAQVSRLMRSAVYFRAGVPCEVSPWFEAIESSTKVNIVDLRRGIELRAMPRHRHGEEDAVAEVPGAGEDRYGEDPHIWFELEDGEPTKNYYTFSLDYDRANYTWDYNSSFEHYSEMRCKPDK